MVGDETALGIEEVLGVPMRVFTDRARSLGELFDGCERWGDREYLVRGPRRVTFAEHIRAVHAVAGLLADTHGIGPGNRVAVLAANSPEWVTLFWATVRLGAVCVALNAWWTRDEVLDALRLTGPSVVVADAGRRARLEPSAPCPVADLEALAQLEGAGGRPAATAVDEDDPAVIVFTSGTSGRARAVVHTHRCLVGLVGIQQHIAASRPAPGPGRVLTTTPLFHVSGLHSGVVAGLAAGSTTVWPGGRADPEVALRTIEAERCTSWTAVPTSVWRVTGHPALRSYDVSSLRHVGGGGAAWSPALQERMVAAFGPQLTWGVGYGLSECTGLATAASSVQLRDDPTTVGQALPTVDVQVRRPDGQRCADGEVGEVCIRSPLVMPGYWNDEAATRAAVDPDRWLHTGDLGHLDAGRLYLSARRDDLILRGAENVYPAVVENALEAHPAVQECAVVGLPDEELGEQVCAVVVRRTGSPVSETELAAHVASRVAYFNVPTRWVFTDAPLPRTATGKVLRTRLRSAVEGCGSAAVAGAGPRQLQEET